MCWKCVISTAQYSPVSWVHQVVPITCHEFITPISSCVTLQQAYQVYQDLLYCTKLIYTWVHFPTMGIVGKSGFYDFCRTKKNFRFSAIFVLFFANFLPILTKFNRISPHSTKGFKRLPNLPKFTKFLKI